MIQTLYQKGWQVAIHANGDAAIEEVIASHIEVQKTHPSFDMRHQVIHAQTASSYHLQSILEHDLTPTFFSNHIKYWGDRHYEMFLGPKRAQRISPAKEAQGIGLAYTLHTDTPINPFQLMHSVVERTTPKGRVLGKKLGISRYQALYAITHMAAWQVHLEHLVGSISPGKQADFVITDKNPLSVHTDLQDVQVLETYIAGKRVHAQGHTPDEKKAA